PRGTRTGVRKVSGVFGRVYLEIHAQRIRLQRPRKYSDYVSSGVGAVEDSGIRGTRQYAELAWVLGTGGVFKRVRAILYAATWRRGSSTVSGAGGRIGAVPDRSRREIQHDRACAVSIRKARAMGGIQLALRQRTGGGE